MGRTQKCNPLNKTNFSQSDKTYEEKSNICLSDVTTQPNFLLIRKCKKLLFLKKILFCVLLPLLNRYLENQIISLSISDININIRYLEERIISIFTQSMFTFLTFKRPLVVSLDKSPDERALVSSIIKYFLSNFLFLFSYHLHLVTT